MKNVVVFFADRSEFLFGDTMSEPRCALENNSDHESESSGEDYCTICEPLEVSCESDSCDSEREYPNTRHMARNDYSEITDLSPYFSRHVKAMDIYTSFDDVEYGLIESFIVLRADPYADIFVSYRSSLSVLRLMVRDHYLESEPLVFRQVWPEVDPDYPFFRKCGRQPIFWMLSWSTLLLTERAISDAMKNQPVDNEPRVQNTELLRRELPPPDLRYNDFRSMGNVFHFAPCQIEPPLNEPNASVERVLLTLRGEINERSGCFLALHTLVATTKSVFVDKTPPPPPRQEVPSSPESEQAETVQSDGGSPDESTQSPSVSEGTVTSEPRPRVFQAMRVPIMVRDLPPRSSDSSIKDGLYHKFKKYGKVVEVKVIGSGSSRYAIVHFRREVDAQAALENAMNEVFFGKPLNAVLASSEMDVEDNEKRPLARDVDCYHPKSSRTLYVGNLDNRLREEDLTKHFNQFGEILDVDIKNRDTPAPFCFIQFADIVSVVNAILAMETDGIIGRNKVKVGFGKPVPTTMVWIDDLPTHVTEVYLRRKLGFYGCVIDVIIDAQMHQAVVVFDDVDAAQKAVQGMKGSKIYEARIQVDFCSREMYDLFIDRMHKAGLLKNSPSDSGLAESIGSRSTAKSNKRKATSELKHCTFKRERERERDQSLISNDSMLSPGSSSDGRQTRANSECSSVGGGSVKLDTIFSGDSIAGKNRRAKVSRTQLESSKIILNDVQFDCSTALIFCSSDWEQHQTCMTCRFVVYNMPALYFHYYHRRL
ncbi:putative RNA recognition motif protein [Trichinella spiralis]|uniref:putative RNA recognition motif protein n=1 Tax=Trichinella spiralis TaxID=6334 RepID=UPI0001EFD336|nr:putative RNA recognition motif protein [Trichinella spiralis]